MNKTAIYGVIVRDGTQCRLSVLEYEYWNRHVLPMGWYIVAKPIAQEQE